MDDHLTGILSNIGVISFVALSAYLLLLTGEISFGQQAFFAIGAYTAGIVTAMWQLPFWLGLGAGAAAGGAAALFVGLPTLRLHGLQFAIATLAFAEAVRILFELFRYQVVRDGEPVGPNGIEGFRNIRYIFEHDVSATQFMLIIYVLLGVTLFGFFLLERSRLGVAFRMIGQDGLLAAAHGVPVFRVKLIAACLAGAGGASAAGASAADAASAAGAASAGESVGASSAAPAPFSLSWLASSAVRFATRALPMDSCSANASGSAQKCSKALNPPGVNASAVVVTGAGSSRIQRP